jgi:Reverse transcriptase (RNA-dependent DNA polymerase)
MDKLVCVLLYADDLVLMAESPQELQLLLDCLYDFCSTCGLTVNVKKSEVVVYNSADCSMTQCAAGSNVLFGAKPLESKAKLIYLGVMFADGEAISEASSRNLIKAKQSAYMMFRRCYSMNMHNVTLLMCTCNAILFIHWSSRSS